MALPPSDARGRPAFGKNRYPRAYPIDSALCGAYGLPPREGPAFETLALRHLVDFVRRIELEHGERIDLTYWRDDQAARAAEVDFRLRSDRLSVLVEAKATEQILGRHLTRIPEVAQRLKPDASIIVHRGQSREVIEAGGHQIHLWPIVDLAFALSTAGRSMQEILGA